MGGAIRKHVGGGSCPFTEAGILCQLPRKMSVLCRHTTSKHMPTYLNWLRKPLCTPTPGMRLDSCTPGPKSSAPNSSAFWAQSNRVSVYLQTTMAVALAGSHATRAPLVLPRYWRGRPCRCVCVCGGGGGGGSGNACCGGAEVQGGELLGAVLGVDECSWPPHACPHHALPPGAASRCRARRQGRPRSQARES